MQLFEISKRTPPPKDRAGMIENSPGGKAVRRGSEFSRYNRDTAPGARSGDHRPAQRERGDDRKFTGGHGRFDVEVSSRATFGMPHLGRGRETIAQRRGRPSPSAEGDHRPALFVLAAEPGLARRASRYCLISFSGAVASSFGNISAPGAIGMPLALYSTCGSPSIQMVSVSTW